MSAPPRHPPEGAGDLARLVALVARLRAPDGCPWDREQTLADIRAYLLEEAHEAAAAIDAADPAELAGELGDLLFQVAFVLRLAEEAGEFTVGEVVSRVEAKMIERHPHVFGDAELADVAAVAAAWERRKVAGRPAERSHLDGVPTSLPALLAAYRMTQKAAGVGFDWPEAAAVLDKVEEEVAELRSALAERDRAESAAPEAPDAPETPGAPDPVAEELGDLLFTVANLARKLGHDPEATLAAANAKFRRRFAAVERRLATSGATLGEAGLDELDRLWEEVKGEE